MDNLIEGSTSLELCAWLEPGSDLPGWDILKGNPFGASLGSPPAATPFPGGQITAVQSYFAEYHLEYFRQRCCKHFPCRLHALLLFATTIDALVFREKHPHLLANKQLAKVRSQGSYLCSFHDASWLDYLRLPHSLDFAALDEVAGHYWAGRTVEEVAPTFMDAPWRELPVIETIFQGTLAPNWTYPCSGRLLEFARETA